MTAPKLILPLSSWGRDPCFGRCVHSNRPQKRTQTGRRKFRLRAHHSPKRSRPSHDLRGKIPRGVWNSSLGTGALPCCQSLLCPVRHSNAAQERFVPGLHCPRLNSASELCLLSDLVRVRYYFLVDLTSAALTTILFAPHFWWLAVPQV